MHATDFLNRLQPSRCAIFEGGLTLPAATFNRLIDLSGGDAACKREPGSYAVHDARTIADMVKAAWRGLR